MKRNTRRSALPSSIPDRKTGVVPSGRGHALASPETKSGGPVAEKAAGGCLLRFCHEVAGLLIRRHLTGVAPATARREVRARLIDLMKCSEERAEWLVDLSLEIIHVKTHGRFERNPLELSLLIARAGNQLRDVANN